MSKAANKTSAFLAALSPEAIPTPAPSRSGKADRGQHARGRA